MSLLESAAPLKVDRDKARELFQQYRAARVPATDEDRAIMETYRQIARGRVIIQAFEAIRQAGWNDEGLPVLGLARADLRELTCRPYTTMVEFWGEAKGYERAKLRIERMPDRPTHHDRWRRIAQVPLIPIYLRPKHDLKNYWILFEADWHRAPVDPLLLRRLEGDLWIVLAAWNLTDVERAAMGQRVNA